MNIQISITQVSTRYFNCHNIEMSINRDEAMKLLSWGLSNKTKRDNATNNSIYSKRA